MRSQALEVPRSFISPLQMCSAPLSLQTGRKQPNRCHNPFSTRKNKGRLGAKGRHEHSTAQVSGTPRASWKLANGKGMSIAREVSARACPLARVATASQKCGKIGRKREWTALDPVQSLEYVEIVMGGEQWDEKLQWNY